MELSEVIKIIKEWYTYRDLMKDLSTEERNKLIGKLQLIEELENLQDE